MNYSKKVHSWTNHSQSNKSKHFTWLHQWVWVTVKFPVDSDF